MITTTFSRFLLDTPVTVAVTVTVTVTVAARPTAPASLRQDGNSASADFDMARQGNNNQHHHSLGNRGGGVSTFAAGGRRYSALDGAGDRRYTANSRVGDRPQVSRHWNPPSRMWRGGGNISQGGANSGGGMRGTAADASVGTDSQGNPLNANVYNNDNSTQSLTNKNNKNTATTTATTTTTSSSANPAAYLDFSSGNSQHIKHTKEELDALGERRAAALRAQAEWKARHPPKAPRQYKGKDPIKQAVQNPKLRAILAGKAWQGPTRQKKNGLKTRMGIHDADLELELVKE
ncbi:hypothetical protein K504DRAFT_505368 [Pleomassaria siparia CBS 279.74]|uniref:Uncharacterized protein n=1 Tax=Pleomassaria siparia CBS 279.74 TaxID=1314801 RepID=A0A6G1K0T7_9PLEO|nr:hypothetical protein K504DRAFT_505368 [Pleomassaria siparia CBS 279.74]